MRKVVFISLLCNVFALAAIVILVFKFGGISNILFKFNHQHALAKMDHRNSSFASTPPSKGSIIFLGDSITEFGEWAELFPSYRVLNRGIAGDGIMGVLNRLSEVKRHDPKLIFLMIGVNDLCFHPPKEVIQSYRKLLDKMLIEFNSSQLIIQAILPVNNNIYSTGTENEQIDEVNRQIANFCAKKGITNINLSSVFKDEDNNLKKAFTQDGIHINGIAYNAWSKSLIPWLPIE